MHPVYQSYAELAAAFKSGELDKHYYLMLDKGGMESWLRYNNPDASDEENESKDAEAGQMFPGDHNIDELFVALGIRSEWC